MARPPYRAEQRDQIFACFVNAASEIMDEEGVENLTLRKVAQRAGYNSATLYNYFKDLDHLIIYASMKYFQAYNEGLAGYMSEGGDPYTRFCKVWTFFCNTAFEHPHAFFNLFYGRYSSDIEQVIRRYYRVFPSELEKLDDEGRELVFLGDLKQRNLTLLRPLVEAGLLPADQAEVDNEIMLCCFKELLSVKIQRGETVDNHTLCQRQLTYIRAILRQ